MTEKEIFQEEIVRWRTESRVSAHPRPSKTGLQSVVEARTRHPLHHHRIMKMGERSQKRYARLFASLVTSHAKRWYEEKLLSYFEDIESDWGKSNNLRIAQLLCLKFGERIEWLEPMISKDAVCSANYAFGNASRFEAGESVIRQDAVLWEKYRKRFLPESTKLKETRSDSPRISLPSIVRYAWS